MVFDASFFLDQKTENEKDTKFHGWLYSITYVLAMLKLSIANIKINQDALSIISNDSQVTNSS
jgi:hypothetical protein